MLLTITIITYVMNLLDLRFTLHLAHEYGDDIEGNPIGKQLLKNKPLTAAVKVLMAIPLTILYFLHTITLCKICLWIIFAIYLLLTLYHIFILIYLEYHKKRYDL